MAYEHVNGEWPCASNDLPALTFKEGVTATKRLYRLAMKRRCKWKFVQTSGRRYGGMDRSFTWFINPERGWWILVHNLSHHLSYRLHPGKKPHSSQHAFLERTLIRHVVTSGWLDGKLKRPEPVKVPKDVRAMRAARVAAGIKRWAAKKRRAETALRKLNRQARYYAEIGSKTGQETGAISLTL